MRGCLVASQERCIRYARETCDPIYANMRIAVPGAPIDPRFSGKPLRRLRVTRHDKLKLPTAVEQAEREWMSMHWSSQAAHGLNSTQEFPKEGWVGGLVHPAPGKSPAKEYDSASPKHPALFPVLEWLQKLQQSLMARFSS
jgi:hypothetical protein